MENSFCKCQQVNTDIKQQLDEFKNSYEQSQVSNQELNDQLNSLKGESGKLQRINIELLLVFNNSTKRIEQWAIQFSKF